MHSLILHYTIHSTTRITLLYHPESNPFRIAPLTFPSPSKSILSDYLKLQDNRSTILIYVFLTYSIQFNPLHSFQPIRLIQFHSTRPEILFRSTEYESHNHTKQKKEKEYFQQILFLWRSLHYFNGCLICIAASVIQKPNWYSIISVDTIGSEGAAKTAKSQGRKDRRTASSIHSPTLSSDSISN